MSYLLLKHYYKGKKYKINYIINELKLLKIFLGRLNKKGYKNMSYFILAKVLYFLKKNIELEPKIMFKMIINKIKPCILLFNKKRGTVIFELPRFLTFEQSFKRSIEWLVKVSNKKKKKIIKDISLEIKDIILQKGEILNKREQIIDIAIKNKAFYYLLRKKR